MPPQPFVHGLLRHVCFVTTIALAGTVGVCAQEGAPPAYLASVDSEATLERGGVAEPATRNMPFVPGDRVRTAAGRVEIVFPDGSGIEVGEHSEVEAVSATRVRLLAGTMDHIQRQAAASRSAGYLPPDLQTYGNTFDQYGSWQYDSSYGNVWYPAVGAEWRPYSYGSWSPIRSYGWTWVGLDAWAWPTHHYGRWGYARNSWFWIPGRTWGAAWVSWSFADDYVSWCPLGYDSRPVFALSVGHRRGWDDWTVPRRTFASRGYVNDYSRTREQSSVAGRQSSVAGRQSSVLSRQSPAIGRQSTDDRRPRTGDARLRSDDRRPTTAAPQTLPAASGGAMAMPRAQPAATTDYRRPTNDYRRPATDSRPPTTDYRQRTDVAVPRATAPERVYVPSPSYRVREQSPRQGYTPPPQTNLPAASGGAIAMPRAQPGATTDYRRPTTDYRPPTSDSRRHEAPAASGGASAPRPMPHERAAPSGGDARPRAQERPAEGQGRRR